MEEGREGKAVAAIFHSAGIRGAYITRVTVHSIHVVAPVQCHYKSYSGVRMPVAELNFAGECYHCGGGGGRLENNVARACVRVYTSGVGVHKRVQCPVYVNVWGDSSNPAAVPSVIVKTP